MAACIGRPYLRLESFKGFRNEDEENRRTRALANQKKKRRFDQVAWRRGLNIGGGGGGGGGQPEVAEQEDLHPGDDGFAAVEVVSQVVRACVRSNHQPPQCQCQ